MTQADDLRQMLDYRRSPTVGEQAKQWKRRLMFPFALSSSLIALIGSSLSSWVFDQELMFDGGPNFDIVGLMSFVVGVPLAFLLLITSAVTFKLAFSTSHEPWRRRTLAVVLLPQAVALMSPFLVVLLLGRAR